MTPSDAVLNVIAELRQRVAEAEQRTAAVEQVNEKITAEMADLRAQLDTRRRPNKAGT